MNINWLPWREARQRQLIIELGCTLCATAIITTVCLHARAHHRAPATPQNQSPQAHLATESLALPAPILHTNAQPHLLAFSETVRHLLNDWPSALRIDRLHWDGHTLTLSGDATTPAQMTALFAWRHQGHPHTLQLTTDHHRQQARHAYVLHLPLL